MIGDGERKIKEIERVIAEEGGNYGLERARLLDYVAFIPNEFSTNSKVLDIGILGGNFSILLKEIYNCEIYGIDVKRDDQSKLIKRFKKYDINFTFCDVARQKLPFLTNYFDLVLFLEVLEHLITPHPPYFLFKEINRVMKPNGRLILSTPNVAELIKRIYLLIGKNPLKRVYEGFDEDEFYRGYYREYTLAELRHILTRAGFEVERVKMRDYSLYSRRHHPLLRMIYSSLTKVNPSFRGTILISAKKNEIVL